MKTTSKSMTTICLSPSPSPSLSAEGETMSECSICLESYRSGQEVSILACSHEYHSSCIGEWMLKNRSCPMCRKDIHNQPQFVTLLIWFYFFVCFFEFIVVYVCVVVVVGCVVNTKNQRASFLSLSLSFSFAFFHFFRSRMNKTNRLISIYFRSWLSLMMMILRVVKRLSSFKRNDVDTS